MSMIREVLSSEPSFINIGQGVSLPRELLAEILERSPSPVVVGLCTNRLFLNAKARALWLTGDVDSSTLPVMVDGKVQPLSTLHSVPTHGDGFRVRPQVRVPGGEQYEADLFHWKCGTDSPVWRVAILRPLDQGSTEGGLLTDKIKRLKAIVHELRNTLTAAREALAFLHEGVVGELNAEQRRFLDSAMEDLESLGRAMVELTSLWVTQAGILRMMPRPVDVRRVVEQTTLCARPVAEKQGISLQVEVGHPPLILTGDHELLVQALRNVLINAFRHTPVGGEIRVRAFVVDAAKAAADGGGASHAAQSGCAGADESVVIEVHDSGAGIQPADRERVFQEFERGSADGSAEGSPDGGGMGLGLAIARDIASRHGGTLHVQSTPGEGACFVFRFPKSETCARWMVRATQCAIEDVRPLRAPLASVLLRFAAHESESADRVHPDLLFALQQVAIENLRPTDTVLAIEGQLLMLIRGSTRSGAYALVDRVLHSLAAMSRAGAATVDACSIAMGVAIYPDDGDSPDELLAHAAAELSAFPVDAVAGTEESHERETDDPAGG